MNRRRFFSCLAGAPVAGMSVMFLGDLNPKLRESMAPSAINDAFRETLNHVDAFGFRIGGEEVWIDNKPKRPGRFAYRGKSYD